MDTVVRYTPNVIYPVKLKNGEECLNQKDSLPVLSSVIPTHPKRAIDIQLNDA